MEFVAYGVLLGQYIPKCFGFSLSVSFHKRVVHIHSSVTDATISFAADRVFKYKSLNILIFFIFIIYIKDWTL